MVHREIIAVCSEIHTEHVNALCGQNGELLGAFAKMSKNNFLKFFVFLSQSIHMKQLISDWMDCHEV